MKNKTANVSISLHIYRIFYYENNPTIKLIFAVLFFIFNVQQLKFFNLKNKNVPVQFANEW